MPGERIGRAVLELTTDSKSFFSDTEQAEKRVVTLKGAFEKAKPPLDAMARGMSDAGKAATDSAKLIEGMSAAGRQSIQNLEKPVSGLSLKFVALGAAAGTFVANLGTQALQSFGSMLQQAAADGAKFAALAPGFERLTASIGTTSTAMLAMTRSATKGLISDLDLMQSTNKAVLLGLPVTAQEMSKLAATAVSLGRAMGQDATASLNDLITALGRSSPMILDNLGLTVKVGEANEEYAKKLGKTADSLTEAERKTAFYQAAMRAAEAKTNDLGDVQLTLSEQFGRVTTAIGNMLTGVTAAANRYGGFVSILSRAADVAERLAHNLDVLLEAQQRTGKSFTNPIGGLALFNATNQIEMERALAMAASGGAMGLPKPPEIGAAFSGMGGNSPLNADTLMRQSEAMERAVEKRLATDKRLFEERKRFLQEVAEFNAQQFRDAQRDGLPGFLAAGQKDTTEQLPVPTAVANVNQSLFGNLPDMLRRENVFGPLAPPAAVSFSKAFSASLKTALPNAIQGAMQGGGDAFKSAASAIGNSLTQSLFGDATSGFGKAISGGINKLLGQTLGGAVNTILPGIGSLIGPAISGVTKLFGKLFGSESKRTNDERDSVLGQMFGTQDEFRRLAAAAGVADAEIRKVFSASKVKDFQAALQNVTTQMERFTAESEADAQRLTAAIQKYGFTFEQLGPAFQRQRLDEQAKELIEDWRVLVASGIDLTLVNERMSEAINGYVQQALRVGAELPNAFRPILLKMAEQGLLTDEAGNAITDLEAAGISFAESMTQGFDRVIEKLNELIVKMVAAGTAMASIPTVPDIGDIGAASGVDYNGALTDVPVMGKGALALGPTFGLVGESGPEAIVPLSTLERWMFGRGGSGDSSGVESRLEAVVDAIGGLRRQQRRMPFDVAAAVMGKA